MKIKVLLVLLVVLLSGFFTSINATAVTKEQHLVYNGWSNDLRITSDSGNSQSPSIAMDIAGNSHIVWADNRSGTFEIFYEKRSAAGYTLIDDTQLTTHTSDARYRIPKVVVGSDACLHIMWLADSSLDTLYYMKVDIEGHIVTNAISLNVDSRWVCYDFIIAQEGSVFVACIVYIGPANLSEALLVTPRPTEVFFMKISDNGAVLLEPTPLTISSPYSGGSTGEWGCYVSPRIAMDTQGYLQIAMGWFWGDPDSPTFAGSFIHYMKITTQGNIVVQDTRLTPNFSGENWYSGVVYPKPKLCLDSNNNVFIVWEDKRNEISTELYYTKLNNLGVTIIDDTPLTAINIESTEGNFMYPSAAIDNVNNLHVVWSDYRNDDHDYELFYTCVDANGQVRVNSTRLTISTGASTQPSLAAPSGSTMKIVWHDDRDSNNEIYYKQWYESMICGDANSNGIVDLSDIIYLINYLFKGGPTPSPLCIGDVNGDDTITIGDVVYLINYLYKGGSTPGFCCT